MHILNGDLSYKGSIRDFTDRDGNAVEIDGAQGLTVYNDQLYIADSDRSRILRTDAGGNVDLIIEKPDTPMLGEEIACIFTKVLIGSEQRIFAIASDVNMGAMVFDQNGRFLTFFGSADVETTAAVLLEIDPPPLHVRNAAAERLPVYSRYPYEL